MRKSKFTPEQILQALRQAESGTTVVDICRKLGVTETTFYRWKKQYTGLDVSELRELKQLRDENRRLKGVDADLTLDKAMLRDALGKNGEPKPATRGARLGAAGVPGQRAASVPGPGDPPRNDPLSVREAGRRSGAPAPAGARKGSPGVRG
jgi:putative transposase